MLLHTRVSFMTAFECSLMVDACRPCYTATRTMARNAAHRYGTLYAIAAFTLWGLLPLYWRPLDSIPAHEILAHRTLWSCVFASLVLLALGKRGFLGTLAVPALRRAVLTTGLLLGINWFTYILAVNSGRVLQVSMGYYINPLFSILLGRVFLRERLTASQRVAVLFAAAGVVVITLGHGVVPWIALILMGSFGFYGLVKKTVIIDAMTALAIETLVLTPIAAGYIIHGVIRGSGALGRTGPAVDALLLGAGAVSAIPLYLFAKGAQRIPLARVGFIQYIAPTLMFLLGVALFGEPFTPVHAVSFGLIWTGLAIYSLSHTRLMRRIDTALSGPFLPTAEPVAHRGHRPSDRTGIVSDFDGSSHGDTVQPDRTHPGRSPR
ncbi:MAG: EamA family transporter RarD [Spirochaetaceae bacterium]|nr:MAG: EamA family transporter RarD [Spirochaetaceae bacterium]